MTTTTRKPTGRTRLTHSSRDGAHAPWGLRQSDGLTILEAEPLKKFKWIVHGFSTRRGGVSELKRMEEGRAEKVLNLGFTDWDRRERVERNRGKFARAIGAGEMHLITLRQMHSDIIHVVDDVPAHPVQGDAIVTRTRGLLISVQTADCIPIVLLDPANRAVAAIHAGWRGTLRRIAAKTVGRMRMLYSTKPEEVVAAIGPGIARCSYEVGPEVVREFASQFPMARDWFAGPYDQLSSTEDPNPLPWLTMMPPGHESPAPGAFLDLPRANESILREAGLKSENIATAAFCTACRTDLFFSYRRERDTGRQMAAIGILAGR
jgi:polyphenol oxidase